ncbi:DUF4347 domain-containing protein [Zobellia uliginosa]|uniref:DUF4347 domain-containing protein n=1 Tax=Zobellia uliginosa TaxID=143224 RepID=UPI0026E3F4F1|nr:DUF4347 domain-containing protein [Zobellia uliginosa]MDO6519329.1 DUF4347 domain-containing protein [Zobellia uliginosa]
MMRYLLKQKTLNLFFFLFVMTINGTIAQSNELIIIDSDYAQKQRVLEKASQSIPMLEINKSGNPWRTIRNYLEQNRKITTLHLFANTSSGALKLGGVTYDSAKVDQEFEFAMLEGLYQGTNYQLLIYDCTLGSNKEGLQLLDKIGGMSYFIIAVPTNCSSVFNTGLEFDHTTLDQPIAQSILN